MVQYVPRNFPVDCQCRRCRNENCSVHQCRSTCPSEDVCRPLPVGCDTFQAGKYMACGREVRQYGI